VRLFFAVEFDDSLKDAVVNAIEDIGIEHPPWRWVARTNLHVTLKFLGETPEDRVDTLVDSVTSACRDISPFEIALGRLGGFPNLKRPRVLFYGVTKGADALASLAEHVETALFRDLSIPKERRPFRAHGTVARIKRPLPDGLTERLEGAPAVKHPAQVVEKVSLMQSELRRDGAVYRLVKGIALAKPKC
jgi:2'-5' RNA ligase